MPIVSRSSQAPDRRFPHRHRVAPVIVLAAVTLGLAVPARAADPAPPGLTEFKGALGWQESGGNYTARNPVSGAYGKYQIMPANWPVWALRYLDFTKAPQTPVNQERVASGKLTSLFNWLGAWDRTAYWWLTGTTSGRGTWSAYASRYVDNVMLGYRTRRATPPPGGMRFIDDGSGIARFAGSWGIVRNRVFLAGGAHVSKARGAAAGVRFVGVSVRFIGPKGATRGRVAVYVDGRYVKTVDLRSWRFVPRAVLFSVTWARRGEHWVELRNLAPAGRPYVTVDEVVTRG